MHAHTTPPHLCLQSRAGNRCIVEYWYYSRLRNTQAESRSGEAGLTRHRADRCPIFPARREKHSWKCSRSCARFSHHNHHHLDPCTRCRRSCCYCCCCSCVSRPRARRSKTQVPHSLAHAQRRGEADWLCSEDRACARGPCAGRNRVDGDCLPSRPPPSRRYRPASFSSSPP